MQKAALMQRLDSVEELHQSRADLVMIGTAAEHLVERATVNQFHRRNIQRPCLQSSS